MDDITNSIERLNGSLNSPVVVIVEPLTLARTCLLSLLRRELVGFDILDVPTARSLDRTMARDLRLLTLSIGDKPIADTCVEEDLSLVMETWPHASIALLSNHDDEAMAVAAMQRGVRGFFPTSMPVEVVIAGLRLVLAGGVYRPLPLPDFNKAQGHDRPFSRGAASSYLTGDPAHNGAADKSPADFTPREQQVLAALELGLPNKLIAARLNLSENTVKMHIQHIMRKCAARKRTEAVLRWSGRLAGPGRDAEAGAASTEQG